MGNRTSKSVRLTPAQMRYLHGAEVGLRLNRPSAEGGQFGDLRVVDKLKALGLIVNDGLDHRVTNKGMAILHPKAAPLLCECEDCDGTGEVQASCSNCDVSLTSAIVSEEDDSLCLDCASEDA